MLKIDNFDDCLIGKACVWGEKGFRTDRLIYDGDAMMAVLMHRDKMEYEEALEYIQFNIEGAYVGAATPIVVWPVDDEDL
jgi:hypothetical protein